MCDYVKYADFNDEDKRKALEIENGLLFSSVRETMKKLDNHFDEMINNFRAVVESCKPAKGDEANMSFVLQDIIDLSSTGQKGDREYVILASPASVEFYDKNTTDIVCYITQDVEDSEIYDLEGLLDLTFGLHSKYIKNLCKKIETNAIKAYKQNNEKVCKEIEEQLEQGILELRNINIH